MVLSVFFIVLLIAFAAIAFFTEPSKTDKRIHSRLFSLDRQAFSCASHGFPGLTDASVHSLHPSVLGAASMKPWMKANCDDTRMLTPTCVQLASP